MFFRKKTTSDESSLKSSFNLKFILRALKYRNYRLFFIGQTISLTGTWMQQVAVSWLVYRLTNSALLLGVVAFVSQIPVFILSPFTGVLADRINRHRILIFTQSFSLVQAFILAFLVLSGHITIIQVIFLSVALGVISAFDIPARHAFVFELVEKKEDFGNAIALNSLMFNIARLIGPFFAGLLIAAVGEGVCFLINGASYIAVIFALLLMRVAALEKPKNGKHVFQEIRDGLNYAYKFIPIRFILLFVIVISLAGMSYAVLMPIFAAKILRGGPHTFGFLMASLGLGALIGAIYLASYKNILGYGKLIAFATALFGLGLITFSFSKIILLSLFILMFVGFGMIIQMAGCNTLLQTVVDDDKRGRIMSLYTMAFMGMGPIGNLLVGGLANKIGASNALMIGGAICFLAALLFAAKIKYLKKYIQSAHLKISGKSETTSMGLSISS